MLDGNPNNETTLRYVSWEPNAFVPRDFRKWGSKMIPQWWYGKLPIGVESPCMLILQIPIWDRDGVKTASNFIGVKIPCGGESPWVVSNNTRDISISGKPRVVYYPRAISICCRGVFGKTLPLHGSSIVVKLGKRSVIAILQCPKFNDQVKLHELSQQLLVLFASSVNNSLPCLGGQHKFSFQMKSTSLDGHWMCNGILYKQLHCLKRNYGNFSMCNQLE